ncbi:alpha/beta hydrolase [Staphylococcus argensis]|uniref:Alpha/beta hydrolase n=1 Tax=Staphylococcus argensis TaxID=1607738 RepID=A0A2K4FBJ7_9STAP|nr:alpha/beta hydrolase [Staphylococcus argensis]MCY6991882.1 alpha/beta hydrolase [Staphylococcus argensis]POA08730.1 alpha/beta hydrolase [Staphylococcus argensis]
MKKLAMILFMVLLTTSLSACSWVSLSHKKPTYTSKEITPTLYLHGYSGTLNSTKYLIHSATNEHKHETVYATVDAQGHVTVDRPLSNHDRHPIVIIKLEDNENGDYPTNAQWIKNVLVKLEDQQKFDQYNMVMHSMANMSFSYFMLEYGNDKDLPKLNKQVNIAGTFDGVLGMDDKANENHLDQNGKPERMTKEYRDILPLKQIYRNKHIQVLNIYGDVEDGSHSDRRVSNVSSQSLEYIIGDVVDSYNTLKITGKEGDHSELHDSAKVAHHINQFLWGHD